MEETLWFLATTFLLSVISFYCIEKHFRKVRADSISLLGYSFVAAATLASPAALASLNHRLSAPPLPIEQKRYADRTQICHGKIVGDCVRGSRFSDLDVLVLGDSHAAMLNHFFEVLGKRLEFKATVITASNCVTVPGFDVGRLKKWAQEPCSSQISVVEETLIQASNIILAGNWSGQTRSHAFVAELDRFLSNQSNKTVFLLSQVPRLKTNILRVRRVEALGFKLPAGVDRSYIAGNEKIKMLAGRHPHVHYVSFDSIDLFGTAPYFDPSLIYFDEHHLNELGANLYAQHVEPIFESDVLGALHRGDQQPPRGD